MADDILQRKLRVLVEARASWSRIVDDLSEYGYSLEEIKNAIEELAQIRAMELETKRSFDRIVYVLWFLVGLLANIYLLTFSDTHYGIVTGLFALMALGAVGFFLTVKPRRPRRR